MKRFFAFTLLALLGLALPLSAAEKRHSIVFEVTSPRADDWNAALNNIENLRRALGPDQTRIELVAHGNGLSMLLAANNPSAERIQRLAGEGVVFAACQNTMKRQHVTTEQLVPGSVTVDSGVAEIVRRQEDGWSYIRSH